MAQGHQLESKAAGVTAWAKAIAEAKIEPFWEFHEVLGQDVEASLTLGSMLDKAVAYFEANKR